MAASGGGGGKVTAGDGEIFSFGNGGSGGVPPVVRALARWDDEVRRIQHTPQGDKTWTTFARSRIAAVRRLDSVMASALAAIFRGVERDATEEVIINDVSDAIEFNRKAYEGLTPLGDVELRLFLEDDEVLHARVALVQTSEGVRVAGVVIVD